MIGSISIPDVNHALLKVLPMLLAHGQRHTADSIANARSTVEWPGIFLTEYLHPNRCVLFDPVRDANPIFHYLEAMWILAGRNDVKTLARILPRMADYSDDGKVFHAPYGYRLRNHWTTPDGDHSLDQIEEAIRILDASRNSRQVVMSIWDPAVDLGAKSKDLPCNDMIMLKVREHRLNMTVCNRSNDVIWGCYGANAVQFSMLQMYIAARLGVGLGVYVQQSDSFHVYEDNPYWQTFLEKWHLGEKAKQEFIDTVERHNGIYHDLGDANLFTKNPELVLPELQQFWSAVEEEVDNHEHSRMDASQYHTTAVHDAVCLWNALGLFREKRYDEAGEWLNDCMHSSDWAFAAATWIKRRQAAAEAKKV